MSERDLQDAPRPSASAAVLGTLGLLPMFAAAGAFAFGPPTWAGPALLALLAYAATVLAFLGGVRWGIGIAGPRPRWTVLTASTLPQLAAFALLAAPRIDVSWQLGGLLLAFLAQGAWDATTASPRWYARLRLLLTLGAALALAGALAAALRF
jgi:hypothetical protein